MTCEQYQYINYSYISTVGYIANTTVVGKTGRGGGVGAGDQWVKSGDWELGDHVNELRCFDSKLKWVKVCSKFHLAKVIGVQPI